MGAFALIALSGCGGGTERAPGTCAAQRDCADNEVCVAGFCRTPGMSGLCEPGACPAGSFCDPADLRCKPLDGQDGGMGDGGPTSPGDGGPDGLCAQDTDCGQPPVDICVANQCVKGCGQPDGLVCTGGTICDPATGKCLDESACTADIECGPPQRICIDRECVAGCGANPNLCPAGTEVCDTTTGRCVPLPGRCTGDGDCMPPSTVCENMQCVPGCGQPGGVQCTGAAVCDPATGRCSTPGGCNVDSDCMDPDLICVNMVCTPRCDRGNVCNANQVCNPDDGRCLPANLALGTMCEISAQCETSVCLNVTISMMTQQLCALPCAATSECPLNYTCSDLSGMGFCLNENLSSPPASFDTPSGGTCSMGNNTCQSTWCDLNAGTCIEECSRDADCANFVFGCWMYGFTSGGVTNYAHLCAGTTGSAAGAACTMDSNCLSGICNFNSGRCAAHCCRDQDCGPTENCTAYDIDGINFVNVCTPRSASAGSGALGSTCTGNGDCESELCLPVDRTAPTGPRQCTSPCCAHSDCGFLGAGGKCRPFTGPLPNTITGACFSL